MFTSARAANVPTHDLPGSKDSPIVSRFAGSVIVGYQTSDFGRITLPLGKYVNDKFTRAGSAEGKLTRIAYVAPAGKSALEVFHNFRAALSKAGFQTDYACHADRGAHGCGSVTDMADSILEKVTPELGGDVGNQILRNDILRPNIGNTYLETARLMRSKGRVDVVLLINQSERHRTGILLQIVEEKAMPGGEVTVNAKAMGKGLAQAGHIALYGIHFATDSSVLKASSDKTLAEMARLLKSNPGLKVYIVGHTDNSGTLAHNMKLSQQRANSVVKALTGKYAIAASRLAAKGVGPYAPVASNHDKAGRARNRRVELVQQ